MTIKSKVFLFLAVSVLVLSCHKDDGGVDAVVKLQVLYNGEPMVTQKEYTYPDGKVFVLTRFSVYISEMSLESDEQSQIVNDVQFVNMTETLKNASSSAQGYTLFEGKSKLKSIDQLRFNIGLTPGQNSTVPADHASGNPLAMPGEYWLAWKSYIFLKIEGWIDLDGDGMAETGVALHLGSDEVMKSFLFDNLDGGTDLTIQIDLAKVLAQEGKIYDIKSNPQIHSLSQIESLRELSNNLEKAIILKTTL
ncbi:MAG: hypothetical protein IPL46_16980 [Saprospiraceae bacterium]|nr:hypothetical protein [Saprospiraceae bacterium]